LVEFYSPTCTHCQHLLPAYHQAARDLAELDTPIPLGVANVLQYPKFWEKFSIQGTPDLIWFEKGVKFDYTGTRNKDDLVKWVKEAAAKK
jgi:thioredoxin-like negative regulator of GroEL